MVENPEALAMVSPTYEGNNSISEAVTHILHSSDLTSLSALARRSESTQEKEPRVKRPMNAFMLYAQVARRKVATKYPNLNYAKLSKTLGKIWQVLPEEERRPFLQEAERLRTQHKQQYPNYKYTPKRLKSKKPGTQLKKARNLKPQELFSIIQAKCDPESLQTSLHDDGISIHYDEQFPMFHGGNDNYGFSFNPGLPYNSMSLPNAINNYDTQFPGLDCPGIPSRGLSGLDSEMMTNPPNNDVKCYFPDYSSGHLLNTFNNPNTPVTSKTDTFNLNQPLSAFLNAKPETSSTLTPLTNTFGEGLSFSKLIDPIENLSNYLEGRPHVPGYVTI
jgi:hypothetical protein